MRSKWKRRKPDRISYTIGGDQIVVDRATGLMWARDGNAAGCGNGLSGIWTVSSNIDVLVFAGFSDWRMPNRFELASIIEHAGAAPLIWDVFTNTKVDKPYWSSTAYSLLTDNYYYVDFATGYVNTAMKYTGDCYWRAVRKGL